MKKIHKWILTVLLLLLGMSLLIPGVTEMLRTELMISDEATVSQINQYRALHGMMAGLGVMSIMAFFRLEQSRLLVIGIGFTMILVIAGRTYSLFLEGRPDFSTLIYLFIELLLALVFVLFPPPTNDARKPVVRH